MPEHTNPIPQAPIAPFETPPWAEINTEAERYCELSLRVRELYGPDAYAANVIQKSTGESISIFTRDGEPLEPRSYAAMSDLLNVLDRFLELTGAGEWLLA